MGRLDGDAETDAETDSDSDSDAETEALRRGVCSGRRGAWFLPGVPDLGAVGRGPEVAFGQAEHEDAAIG